KVTNIKVQLEPNSFELQTIEKIGKKYEERNEPNIGLQRITIKQLEALPKGVETDVFRSLQYTAGVQSTGDVSSRYYVRGGSADQNLVLINGISVYNPFHALGMFSIFDPEVINSVEFHKGGFTAEYGGRLSSVLNIITKDGNKKRFAGKASLSLLTGKALVEGPIPNGSFMLTGRKTHSNNILKKFLNDNNVPIDFYDFSFKLNYANEKIGKGTKFIFHGFQSGDLIDQASQFAENYKWSTRAFGATWFQVVEQSPMFFNIGVHSSGYEGEVIPLLSNVKPKKNVVQDITLKGNFFYVFDSKDELNVGAEVKDVETNLRLENNRGAVANLTSRGSRISLYVKYKFLRYETFGLDIGTRLNLSLLSRKNGELFEPRINFSYSPLPQFIFKGAFGIYQQDLITLTDENELLSIFEPWTITPSYLEPSKALHYNLGFTTRFSENLTMNIEGYYKSIENLTAVNEKKVFNGDPDLVAGTGEAYGWETTLNYATELYNFSFAYSNSWAYKKVDGWLYHPKYDSRHSLNVGLAFNIGKGWRTSVMWVYNSGLPFTKLVGYYDKFYVKDIYFDNNLFDSTTPFTLQGDRNIGRLPDYHRLDLTLSKKMQLFFMNIEMNFSIINTYDRKNILYFKRDTGERVNMLPFLPTATIRVEI
ncbi:MAG: TonB-dependent receptor, partial [Melioribacteraceae bacterium]